ncbi:MULTISPECIES: Na-translocating system protein MpsC family protein [unclassified Paenibacillus]|uniref:Na-translocating system protein MpsC family protein n=1 Tax=unclassified Paenibacillus TaxID=185978 RepID=UPI0009573BDF|nr:MULTISPECIES: Na-translocating system protein MpsC family protein [unclassified Paenibacillus]ASS65546.1 DUF2294 family protein [Paenibacillus sp. RUD330]SIQ32487.1 Uncharacterized conserved protein [Paenibacillus sp. RU4X]SIQ54064.1 Uncharacterized conserved protein [Paenibacillus sp. RU4T]
MENRAALSQLTSQMGKLLRDRFGKGPESIFVSSNEVCVTMHFRQFVSVVEKIMLQQNKDEAVREMRQLVMDLLLPDFKALVQESLDLEIMDVYYDWNLDNHSGIMVGLVDSTKFEAHQEKYRGKPYIHESVRRISEEAEKLPDKLYSFWTNPRTLIVFRSGILIKLEKELLRAGYEPALRVAKRSLEKSMLLTEVDMNRAVGRTPDGLYLDWKFDKDQSIIVYTFPNE